MSPQNNNNHKPSSSNNANSNGQISPINLLNKDASLRPVSVSKMGGTSSNLSEYFAASSSAPATASASKTHQNNLPSWVKKELESDEADDHIPPSEPSVGTGFVKAAILASGSKSTSNGMSGKGGEVVNASDNNRATTASTSAKNVGLSHSGKTAAATTTTTTATTTTATDATRVMREEASSSSMIRSENIGKFEQQADSNHPLPNYHPHDNHDHSEEGVVYPPHHPLSHTAESSPTIVKQRPPYASYASGESSILLLTYSPYFNPILLTSPKPLSINPLLLTYTPPFT